MRTRLYLLSKIKEGINERLDRKFRGDAYNIFAQYHRGEIKKLGLDDFVNLLSRNAIEHYELAEKLADDILAEIEIDAKKQACPIAGESDEE
jgi:hypothetical protein